MSPAPAPPVVLVTGCSTGIGRACAESFLARGATVVATARRSDTLTGLRAAGCDTLDLDVTDWSVLPRAFDCVVYAASAGGGGPEAYAAAYDVRVRRSAEWARAIGAEGAVQPPW